MGKETSEAYERGEREGYCRRAFTSQGIGMGSAADPVTEDRLRWDRTRWDDEDLAALAGWQVVRARRCDCGCDDSGGIWNGIGGAREARLELQVRKAAGR